MVDAEKVKYICDIYDWDGKGEIDLFFLGDVIYALGLNTTKKVCVSLGQTDEEGKKFAKFDEVVEKVNAAANTPFSSGGYDLSDVVIAAQKYQNLIDSLAKLNLDYKPLGFTINSLSSCSEGVLKDALRATQTAVSTILSTIGKQY